MSLTLKTTKNMCCGLSVVFKITTRRSTFDVRKKSDLSRKNPTTGSPGHVRKIWDWPQPVYASGGSTRVIHDRVRQLLHRALFCCSAALRCLAVPLLLTQCAAYEQQRHHVVDPGTEACLFADDCLIYLSIKTTQDQIQFREDLDALHRWGQSWGMHFNAKKCNIMTITYKEDPLTKSSNLTTPSYSK